jgi:hypothetical protein
MRGGASMAAKARCTMADGDEELVACTDAVVVFGGGSGPHSI